jgi:uncharacterized membrane-anchored protein YitT (DUF2179 family)
MPKRTLQRVLRVLRDYLLMTVGALLVALAVNLFLVPNDVVSGGVSGIAIMFGAQFGTPVGLMLLLLNIPLFIIGWRQLGGLVFGVRTIYATVVMALAIDGFAPYMPQVTRDPLLYTLYGGVLDGIGIGLVLRAQGTTGGLDIVGRLLERWRGISPGQTILAIDGAIFAVAALLFGPEKALYAMLVAFISTRTLDVVLSGVAAARQSIIITAKPDEITRAIIHDLGRGVTLLEGYGGYTGASRNVLLTVVGRSEIVLLKTLVARIDPDAFMVIGEASEVLGEGFQASAQAPAVPPAPVPAVTR